MKLKLFSGLFGVDSTGTLFAPNGWPVIKLPRRFAFLLHRLINKFAYMGLA